MKSDENKYVDFKTVIEEYRHGNKSVVDDLFKMEKKWVKKGKKGGEYLRQNIYYTIKRMNEHHEYCKEYFSKLDKEEIESIYQNALIKFIDEIAIVEDKNSSHLLAWATNYIDYRIRDEVENRHGKITLRDEETGEILETEISIIPEYPASLDDDDIDNNEEQFSGDDFSRFNEHVYDEYVKGATSSKFKGFLDSIDFESILTDRQLEVYPLLMQKVSIDNQKVFSNVRIAEKLNISESRIREIEQQIADKLKKCHDYWDKNVRKRDIPLSQKINEFLSMYKDIKKNISDVNVHFELLMSWLKLYYIPDENVPTDFKQLQTNKLDSSHTVTGLIFDNYYGFNDDVTNLFEQIEGKFHASTFDLIHSILQDDLSPRIKRRQKETIVKTCVKVLQNYVDRYKKDITRIAKYVTTYKEGEKEKKFSKPKTKRDDSRVASEVTTYFLDKDYIKKKYGE